VTEVSRETETMAQFAERLGITLTVEQVDAQAGYVRHSEPLQRTPLGVRPTPNKDEDGWEHYAWSATLHRGSQTLTTPYRMGTAHVGRKGHTWFDGTTWPKYEPTPPTIEIVLDSLASDAGAYEQARNFEDFAADFGYDTDSRKAERMYQACGEVSKQLRTFLGLEEFRMLLEEVERL